MNLETDFIEKLAKIITTNGLTEISLEDGDKAITIRKDILPVNVVSTASTIPSDSKVEQKEEIVEKPISKGNAIISPMVGTFYGAASSESEPFVEVGSEVKAGDIVCVIEAMKLMNEIKSEYTGKITQICVKNGDPIEYGQVLMYVE